MSTDIIKQDIQQLINQWLEAEQNGNSFPVPFDLAWQIAGYSRKDSAKRKLDSYFEKEIDFHISVERTPHKDSTGFSNRENILLSCDTFKEFCMVSKSDVGKTTRRYFIEAEKKWKLVEKHHPQVAEDVELKRLDKMIEFEKLRLKNNELDHAMLTLHGAPTVLALRGMADQVIEVDKPTIDVIDNRHNVRFNGQTLPQIKDYIAKKYGIKFKFGADIRRKLEKAGRGDLIAQTPRTILADYIPDENLEEAYRILQSGSRQLLIGLPQE